MVLEGVKWIATSVSLNGVNIMKVTRAVGYLNSHVVLIFFVIDTVFPLIRAPGPYQIYKTVRCGLY